MILCSVSVVVCVSWLLFHWVITPNKVVQQDFKLRNNDGNNVMPQRKVPLQTKNRPLYLFQFTAQITLEEGQGEKNTMHTTKTHTRTKLSVIARSHQRFFLPDKKGFRSVFLVEKGKYLVKVWYVRLNIGKFETSRNCFLRSE